MCKLCTNIGNVDLLYENDRKLLPGDVKILQEWMKKEDHLPKITDFQMAMFLNSCYYGIEATKSCIENYYTIRTHCPEFFSDRNIEEESLKYHLETVVAVSLPQLTAGNFLVCFIKLQNCKTDIYNFNTSIKIIDMCITLGNQQIGPQEGHILLLDGDGLLLGHILKMNLMSMKKYFFFVQEAMPVRLRQIHVLNVNSVVEKFINIMKPALKKELQEQMYCHSKMDTLFKFVPQELLPEEYGGQAGSIKELQDKQIENIKEHIDLLREDEDFKSDETRRVGRPKNLEDFFGVQGTFKKLEID